MGSRGRCLGSGLPSLFMDIQVMIEVKITVILILGVTPSLGHGRNRGIYLINTYGDLSAGTEIYLIVNIDLSHK